MVGKEKDRKGLAGISFVTAAAGFQQLLMLLPLTLSF